MLRSLKEGVDACVTVTILDGLVLARSAFHHSMNYRSVVVMGRAREVSDRDEKLRVFHALVEHVIAGRSADARQPNEAEIRGTLVLALPIWAGVLPMRLVPQEPVTDERSAAEIPQYVREYRRIRP